MCLSMGNMKFSEAPKKHRHASHRSSKDVPNAGAGPCEVQVFVFLVFPVLTQGKPKVESYLDGGFKYFLCSSLLVEDSHFE